MNNKELTQDQIEKYVDSSLNVYGRIIWNAAIEAAAKVATELGGVSYVDDEIKKLKKV